MRENLLLKLNESNVKLQHFGWCSLAKAIKICEVMDQIKPKLSVELGVFGGRSLLAIALWHKANGGQVIGIDPWSNNIAKEGYDGANAQWWMEQDLDAIHAVCVKAVRDFDVQDVVTLRVDTSDNSKIPDEPIDFLHIDGQHTEQAIKDVRKWVPHTRKAVLMDDLVWMNGKDDHVQQAANLLPEYGFHKTDWIDTGAIFIKR